MNGVRIVFGLIVAVGLSGCGRDAPPEGEGSFEAAELMFDEMANAGLGNSPQGYTKFDFTDGSWIAVRGIDTHKDPDGGTVGMITDAGDFAVFFTHVCGPGPNPIAGLVPDGNSASEAIESARETMDEYKR